ncbi:MAG: tRNA pseudouridine(13) synthase TruD [Planctomycetes bacterium]|nr:tRNA pseudouridine(13) synthase TruD [Planctomycetota bacterium]
MKLKSQPEDFVVVEENTVDWNESGPFAVYRVTKTGLNTFDVIEQLARQFGVTRARVNFSGLKDRHAVTEQIVTVLHGPRRDGGGDNWRAEFAGRANKPVKPSTLVGNRFTITLRAIRADEVPVIREVIDRIRRTGLPNYFDDQRFGSARHGQGFFAKAAIKGDWEEALRLMIGCPARKDSARDKRARSLIRDGWGRWKEIIEKLPRTHERALVQYLIEHPGDWHGACNRIERNLLGLTLVAYQSWLWNEMAAEVFREKVKDTEELAYSRGVFVYPLSLAPEEEAGLRDFELPVPCHRADIRGDDERARVERVLAREGLTIAQFKVDLQKHTFRAFRRKILIRPAGLALGGFESDPLNPGLSFVRLNFALPRGSFATILIKAVQRRKLLEEGEEAEDEGEAAE